MTTLAADKKSAAKHYTNTYQVEQMIDLEVKPTTKPGIKACVELVDINFDFNQDGSSDVWDIIAARSIILGITSQTDDGTCGDRFVWIGLNDKGVCCPEWVICDVSCNGTLSSYDLVIMTNIILGTFEWSIYGEEVCEEVDDEWSIEVEGVNLSDVSAHGCVDFIDAVKFEVENSGDTHVVISEVKFQEYVDTWSFSITDYVSVAMLWVSIDQGYNLLDTKLANEFDGQMIVFDDVPFVVSFELRPFGWVVEIEDMRLIVQWEAGGFSSFK